MNKIKKDLRIGEVATLTAALVRLYQTAVSENEPLASDKHLASLMSEVEKLSSELSIATRTRAGSPLYKADDARDEIIQDLSNLLTGYTSIPFPEKKAAAGRLLSIFKKYGLEITREKYSVESALIRCMLRDFDAENVQPDIALLEGVRELISSLRASQDNFHTASDSFTEAQAEKGASASDIKNSILATINKQVVLYLSSFTQNPDYADFISKFAVEISRANSTVSRREKWAASSKAAENSEDVSEGGESSENAENSSEENSHE